MVLVQPQTSSFKLDAYTNTVGSLLPSINYCNMQADVKGIYLYHTFISVRSWKFCTVCSTGKMLKFWCRP